MKLTEENRLALGILEKELKLINPEIDFELVNAIYHTEMEHQFDHDRAASQRTVSRILENYVENLLEDVK